MQISQRRWERDSHKPDHGSELSSGLPVCNLLDLFTLIFILWLIHLCIDHAHPTMIAGHPFKGGWVQSVGQLQHPDLKRFQIATPILFTPVFPGKNPYDHFTKPTIPSFNDFFSSYFGTNHFFLLKYLYYK